MYAAESNPCESSVNERTFTEKVPGFLSCLLTAELVHQASGKAEMREADEWCGKSGLRPTSGTFNNMQASSSNKYLMNTS